ncbi:MAG: hypothetical protein EPN91_09595 [Salinibacterium sp.]|nr:MAG: hypothetical protein EPN91_09595 [Salinibacterium sp.]
MSEVTVNLERELAVRAYTQGFAIGANQLKQANRHTVSPDTHQHWRQGFEDGRRAVDQAAAAYKEKLRAQAP